LWAGCPFINALRQISSSQKFPARRVITVCVGSMASAFASLSRARAFLKRAPRRRCFARSRPTVCKWLIPFLSPLFDEAMVPAVLILWGWHWEFLIVVIPELIPGLELAPT
jgi:hypothetical protein